MEIHGIKQFFNCLLLSFKVQVQTNTPGRSLFYLHTFAYEDSSQYKSSSYCNLPEKNASKEDRRLKARYRLFKTHKSQAERCIPCVSVAITILLHVFAYEDVQPI